MCTLNFEVHCPKEFHGIKNFITLLKQSNIVGYLPVLQANRIIQILHFLDRQKFSDTIKCMRNVNLETRIKLKIKADSKQKETTSPFSYNLVIMLLESVKNDI